MSVRSISLLAVCFIAALISASAGSAAGFPPSAPSPQAKPAPQVPLVSNPIQPRDGVVTPKLTELWSVGGENDPQGDLVNRPFDVRLAADGTVYLLDWGDVCIRVFGPDGKYLRQVGRKGQGPGEYDTPFYFDVDAKGRVYVVDMRSLRLTRFDPNGKYESSFRLEKIAAEVRLDSSGRAYCAESSTGEPQLTSEFKIVERLMTLVRYSAGGKAQLRVGPFPSEKMMVKVIAGGGTVSGSSPYSPQAVWAVAPDGRLWIGHNATYEMGVYDPDGKPIFRFGRAFKPARNKTFDELTPENRRRTVLTETFPAYAPGVFFDDEGNAWLRMYRNDDKSEPFRYDVFSPKGIYLKQYVLPCRIYQVRNGRMIAVVETEDGFRALKCYRY